LPEETVQVGAPVEEPFSVTDVVYDPEPTPDGKLMDRFDKVPLIATGNSLDPMVALYGTLELP
jgi:hypothetical protein